MSQTEPRNTAPEDRVPFWRQLRWSLILVLVGLVLVPILLIASVTLQQTARQGREQAARQLESIAELKTDQILRFVEEGNLVAQLILADAAHTEQFQALVTAETPDPAIQREVFVLFADSVDTHPFIRAMFLYNRDGVVVGAHDPADLGKVVTLLPFYQDSFSNQHQTEPPYFDVANNELTLVTTHPILDASGEVVGVLAAELDTAVLGRIMTERTGLGTTGETYLVSRQNNYLLTPSRLTEYSLNRAYYSEGINRALRQENGSATYDNYMSPRVRVIGVYRWIPELEAGMLAEISEEEALAASAQAGRASLSLALLAAFIAVTVGSLAAARVSSPIQTLTQVASRIASGDLSQRAKVPSRNEIGLLAKAFNSMAEQLEELIGSLEKRVQDRTRDLELAAEVSREVASALNLEEMLPRVVELTKAAFSLYHAHIYLLDPAGHTLRMEAGAGEPGQIMKNAGHSIPLDAPRSLVARAARTGQPVIVNDALAQPDFLPNPLLPNTRSEMAVPLRLGNDILGVLDVQADTSDRFSESDASVLSTLAGQVAVAVRNARLFEDTNRSQTLLRAVIDSTPDWIWAKDEQFRFILINRSLAEQGLGVTPEEALGKDDYAFTPRELVDGDPERGIIGFRNDDIAALSGQIVRNPYDVASYRDGSEHVLDTTKVPLRDASGRIYGVLGMGRDITDLDRARRRQRAAYELGERLNSVLEVDELLRETITRLSESFGYYHAQVYLFDEANDRLVMREGHGSAGEALKQMKHNFPLQAARSLVAQAGRALQPIVSNDVQANPDYLPNPLLPETRAEVAVPLFTGNRLIGVLDVQQQRVNAFTEEEVQTLRIIAGQMSIALTNARLFEEAQNSLAETAALYAGSEKIARASSYDEVLQALVGTTELARFDRVSLQLFNRPWIGDDQPEMIRAVAHYEPSGQAIPESKDYPVAQMPVIRLVAADRATIVSDLNTDERVDEFTRSIFRDELGIRGVAAFPLTITGRWLGFVTGQAAGEMPPLDDKAIRQITALVDQAATVVQNIRLLQETQAALAQTAAVQSRLDAIISAASSAIISLDQEQGVIVFNRVAEQTFGYRAEEVMGQSLETFFPDATAITAASTQPPERNLELPARRKNGEEFTAEVALSWIILDNRPVLTLVLTDITERRRVERRERLAYEMGKDLNALFNPDALLRETIRHLIESMGYYHAHVYYYHDDTRQLVLREGRGEVGQMLKGMGHSIPLDAPRSLVARAARELSAVVVNDVLTAPDHLPNPLLPYTRSEVALPLYTGQRLLGVLDVQHDLPNYFSEPEVRTLQIVTNQLAIALTNAELYQEQLQNAERLRELDRLKSEFLANMSHELRTPLNSIIGYSELLIDEIAPTLDEMSAEDLRAIHSSGQHLLAIINDILDLAKIEAGRLELNRAPVDFAALVAQIVESARVLLKDKPDVALSAVLPDDLPLVDADIVRLRQVVWNLLSNAIKFTEHGSVTLKATVKKRMLEVAVSDTGIGIAPEYHELIFDQFRQADGSATRRAGGTGLGLAITRQLIMMHGGRLWLESAIGRGSTFTFTLPLADTSKADTSGHGRETAIQPATEATGD